MVPTTGPATCQHLTGCHDAVSIGEACRCCRSLKLQVLYNLFQWPLLKGSRLAVIGISNTHDLPDKFLPRIARWAVQRPQQADLLLLRCCHCNECGACLLTCMLTCNRHLSFPWMIGSP